MTEKTYRMKTPPQTLQGHWADPILYRDDAAILHEFLPKDGQVPPHTVPYTVFIVILEGVLEIASGSLDYTRYEQGTVVEIPAGDLAGVRNSEETTAEFFVFKAGA
ncbi:MAG TPA: hypothetical protein DF480_00470 [Clostridiales bacterium]|nr:hypothetical protein [Clostridiales bacterium]